MTGKALIAVSTILLYGTSAWAQGADAPPAAAPPAAAPPAAAAPPTAAPPAAAPAAASEDGARFRWGISLAGGLEKVSILSGPMFGVDSRLGFQLNHLLGFYLQTHLSLGSLSLSDGSSVGLFGAGLTGTFTVAGMAEVTLMDRFFAAAGVGVGVLNNPSGFMFQARVGGYPLMGKYGARRKGLMVGLDFRSIFIDGATGILVLGAIGYEAF